jgi:purine-binding chemotaxis protein CheW
MTNNNSNRSDRADRLREIREQRTTSTSDDEPKATDPTADETSADNAESPATEKAPVTEAAADEPGGPGDGTHADEETADDQPEAPDPEAESDQEDAVGQTYQVIEFELGDDRYGVDITRADEVLAYREVTRVPNTADLIRGVVDIRGQIITVIDPTTVFNPRGVADGDGLIVVFEVDLVDGSELIGWAVDNVLSVHTVDEEEIVQPPDHDTTVEAALEREDGYLTLTTPESLLAATGTFDSKLSDGEEPELGMSG